MKSPRSNKNCQHRMTPAWELVFGAPDKTWPLARLEISRFCNDPETNSDNGLGLDGDRDHDEQGSRGVMEGSLANEYILVQSTNKSKTKSKQSNSPPGTYS